MASVFLVLGRPISEGISKIISLKSSTRSCGRNWDGKERGNTGAFALRVRRNPAPSKHGRTA